LMDNGNSTSQGSVASIKSRQTTYSASSFSDEHKDEKLSDYRDSSWQFLHTFSIKNSGPISS
jgi:hypothetical protein